MILTNQQYQRNVFFNSANIISGTIYNLHNNLTSYVSLKKVNRQLMHEYARLLEAQDNTYFVVERPDTTDKPERIKQYSYSYAEVINNSVIRRNNYITLNRGAMHGIEPDMGVITPDGVAGIVINTSRHFSVAMSLLHSDMLLSVKLLKNNQLGSLSWDGSNYREAILSYIPPHIELNRGDTVVTSGFSTVFPGDLFIGTVKDWEVKKGDTFYTVTVELALDFNKLSYVYVVTNLMKEEQDELESSVLRDF